jgi:hypothetical protein
MQADPEVQSSVQAAVSAKSALQDEAMTFGSSEWWTCTSVDWLFVEGPVLIGLRASAEVPLEERIGSVGSAQRRN